MKRRISFLLLLGLVLSLTACGHRHDVQTHQIFAMDTVMDFAAYGGDTQGFFTAATQEINRLEALLSRTREGSDIAHINAGGTVSVSVETAALLQEALDYAQVTGGSFDMTVAPLVNAWGIHTETPRVLTQADIDALLPLVGSEHVHIDGTTVQLDPDCAIDLGGIAKGYASMRVAQLFEVYQIEGGWVSLGGNVYTYGTKDGKAPWLVSIRDPQSPAGTAAMVGLSHKFAVTSGGYQRYFTAEDGTVYQHIIDPATGAPARSDLLSVTIISDNGTMADAYSTALYVMGAQGAADFWRSHRDAFDMVLITSDGKVLYTPGLETSLTWEEGGSYKASILT